VIPLDIACERPGTLGDDFLLVTEENDLICKMSSDRPLWLGSVRQTRLITETSDFWNVVG